MYNIELFNRNTNQVLKMFPADQGGDGFTIRQHDLLDYMVLKDDQEFLQQHGGVFGIDTIDIKGFVIEFFTQTLARETWTEMNNRLKRVLQPGVTLELRWASEIHNPLDRRMLVRVDRFVSPVSYHIGAQALEGRIELRAALPYWEDFRENTAEVRTRGRIVSNHAQGWGWLDGSRQLFAAWWQSDVAREGLGRGNRLTFGRPDGVPFLKAYNGGTLSVLPSFSFWTGSINVTSSTNDIVLRVVGADGVVQSSYFSWNRDHIQVNDVVDWDQEAGTMVLRRTGESFYHLWREPREPIWFHPGTTEVVVWAIRNPNPKTDVYPDDYSSSQAPFGRLMCRWRSRYN